MQFYFSDFVVIEYPKDYPALAFKTTGKEAYIAKKQAQAGSVQTVCIVKYYQNLTGK